MAPPFIFINTYEIKEGQLDAFKKDFRRVLDLVEAEQPRVLYIASYFNEAGTEATVLQIHPDVESFENHMALAEEHIRGSAKTVDWPSMRIQLLGNTNDSVLDNTGRMTGSGGLGTIKTPDDWVDRLARKDDTECAG